MDQENKNPLKMKLPKGNPTHATLMALVGAYLIYMAYQMLRNTLNGNSTMSLTVTCIVGGLMALIGLGVIGYGIAIYVSYRKRMKEKTSDEEI